MARKKLQGSNQRKIDILNAYKDVFSTENGKAVLYDMMKTSSMFGTVFDANPVQMAFNEGRRSFVSQLVQTLELDVQTLHKHMREQEEIDRLYNA